MIYPADLHIDMNMLYKYEWAGAQMKPYSQSIIRELVERESITSQEQLRARLRERGIDATQATLSRDIRELGLVKRTADGAYRSVGTVANGDLADAENVLGERDRRAAPAPGSGRPHDRAPDGFGSGPELAVAIDRARSGTSPARSPETTPSW